MKIKKALKLKQSGKLLGAQIWKNPNDMQQWFIMINKKNGKSFMLVDEDENVIVDQNLNELIKTLSKIGLKQAEMFF
ncbi:MULTISPECIES: hypothetical protein [unclassified Neptuniibacter]|uniref:hypothetical protein n=1 Tax=unclassified Neptuniibacter TaxID=2630693 RepID=UPI000C4B7C4B|nr:MULTISPECIES: hypothetical protein [unclassified Neptuniibacter]MAY41857.1 hypothetical protein [Oceanospirillaceae bacterium]|tara:strand:+ start:3213 stop:3443 length:231 start_codon:yes stop_codon:yes gene_type:complete